jgi:hypothetical protein
MDKNIILSTKERISMIVINHASAERNAAIIAEQQ